MNVVDPTGLQDLPACIVEALRKYFPDDFDFSKVRIRELRFRSPTFSAITFWNEITFSKGEYDPYSVTGLALIGHELTHVMQYEAHPVAFLPKYMARWIGGLAAKPFMDLGERGASGQISAERAAYLNEDLLKAFLRREYARGIPCGCSVRGNR